MYGVDFQMLVFNEINRAWSGMLAACQIGMLTDTDC